MMWVTNVHNEKSTLNSDRSKRTISNEKSKDLIRMDELQSAYLEPKDNTSPLPLGRCILRDREAWGSQQAPGVSCQWHGCIHGWMNDRAPTRGGFNAATRLFRSTGYYLAHWLERSTWD
jgi:hypothetical protein